MFGEPGRTAYDLRFSLLGIPVRVHPLFWLIGVLLGASSRDVRLLLIWVVALFVAILVHELGHALVMRAYGFRPWITLYGFGGLASYNPADAYSGRRLSAADNILISLAGPGAGFLFGGLILGVLKALGYNVGLVVTDDYLILPYINSTVGSQYLTSFTWYILFICMFWGAINLLPVYPLDGGQVSRELFMQFNASSGIRHSLMLSVAVSVGIAAYAIVRWQSLFIGLFFAYLGYLSFTALQSYNGRRW